MVGCALDTRDLQTTASAHAGSSNSAGSSSTIGSGSNKPPEPAELPICTYDDGQVQPGCETLAANAGFTKDTDGWEPEAYSIAIKWDSGDASHDPSSGSISVTNSMLGTVEGLAPGGGTQCLPATQGQIYDMAGDVFIPKGQGAGVMNSGPYVGEAGLSVLFWPDENCSDTTPTKANFQTNLVRDTEAWTHVEGGAVAPDGTKAMSVRVLTVKAFKQFSFKALFDNVLLKPR